MKNPKVSVIIPCYNSEKTLGECLNSVLTQTCKNYEVIVVDNNSTDNTKNIIKEFEKKSKKIRYIFEPKIGRGSARNTGEKNAKGEIILMTDSDCIVPKNWIEKMIEPILSKKAVAVQGIKKPIKLNYWTINIKKEEERAVKQRLKDNKIGLLDTANFAIKKSVLKQIEFSNPKIVSGNDTELEARLKIKNHIIYLKKIPVIHHEPDTCMKLFKKNFIRGRWNAKIRKMYEKYKHFFEKLNHKEYFKSLGKQWKAYHEDFKYNFVCGLGWSLGELRFHFENFLKKYSVKCPCCGWTGEIFLPYGKVKLRENERCPKCGSMQRHRLIYLYLKKIINKKNKLKLLHFAPEKGLIKLFKPYKNINYLSVDINPIKAMQKQDITNLSFKDNSFDIIICIGVLEHIENDKKAMQELYRILKPGGFLIPYVPVYNREKTFEDPTITEPKQREKIFFQHDHVRLYGRDYKNKLENAGFNVKIEKFFDSLTKKQIKKFGLTKKNIYFCQKLP